MCEAANISRATFYEWRKSQAFGLVYSTIWIDQLNDAMPAITASLVDRAIKGNPSSQRLALDALGLIIKQSDVRSTIEVRITRDDDTGG
jgi:hypothetical protein